jgi:hypothetical protein
MKIHTEFASTCFGLRPSSGNLHWSLAKVIFMLKFSKRYIVISYGVVWQYVMYGTVRACNSVIYVFLLLCLCILIVMYVPFCICGFHRASWHSSATLTEVFPCFFLSFKANARVFLAKTGHGPHSS